MTTLNTIHQLSCFVGHPVLYALYFCPLKVVIAIEFFYARKQYKPACTQKYKTCRNQDGPCSWKFACN